VSDFRWFSINPTQFWIVRNHWRWQAYSTKPWPCGCQWNAIRQTSRQSLRVNAAPLRSRIAAASIVDDGYRGPWLCQD